MKTIHVSDCSRTGLILLAALLILPVSAMAQDVSGQARALQATVLGVTSTLAGTGTLGSIDDAREASLMSGSIPSVGSAGVLHATSVGSRNAAGDVDSVSSEASLSNLGLDVAGNSISADFVMSRVMEPASGTGTAASDIEGLVINGVPVSVTGEPNQVVNLLGGGQVILNEQQDTGTGRTVVNALHVIISGVADVAVASASAGITQATTSTDPINSLTGSLGL